MQLHEAKDLIRCDALNYPTEAVWADLGCGSGLFSYALAGLLPDNSKIYAIDKELTFDTRMFPDTKNIIPLQHDFVKDELPLHHLDGILMANALHYVADKPALLDKLLHYLKPGASLLIVEYDTDVPVPVWVPYPLSFVTLSALSGSKGFHNIKKLQERPSLFRRSNLYAALLQR